MDDPGNENLLATETVALARIFIAHLPWLVEDSLAGLPGAVACVGWPKQTTDTCFVLCRPGGSSEPDEGLISRRPRWQGLDLRVET